VQSGISPPAAVVRTDREADAASGVDTGSHDREVDAHLDGKLSASRIP
jgi:hypothetical protein